MKITLSSRWIRLPWTMPVWDSAYSYLVRAGSGDVAAAKEIAGIKAAAAAGHTQWQQIKRNFDAVAGLVLKGLPRPSEFTRGKLRASPLLPRGRPAPAGAAAQLAAMRKAQITRIEKGKLMAQARQRLAAQKTAHEAEVQGYEDRLAALEKVLERRDIADEMRAKLEEQAEGFRAIIEKLKTPAATGEAATTSEPMAAEQVEAEQDDSAAAYPSGASDDVEFADAGT